MIVVKLEGGLGNQMFQYAFGKFLSKRTNNNVKYDQRHLCFLKSRNIAINNLNVTLPIFTVLDYLKFGIKDIALGKKYGKSIGKYFRECMPYQYDKMVEKVSGDVYFDGFWQCEDYFKFFREDLLKEFTPISESKTFNVLCKQVISSNSVSIHVRRGDYLIKKNQDAFGLSTLNYYREAIFKIDNRLDNIKFFCFSDDPEWVDKNIIFDKNYVNISKIGLSPIEEMLLMSKCKHNIIANSTFSWWAAWLNKNRSKIVIAPKKWRNDNISIVNLLPKSWEIL